MTHEDEAPEHGYDHKHETFNDDDLSDPERYEIGNDYQPPEQRKFRKLLDDYRKKNPEFYCRTSMLTTKPARRWQQDRETRHTPKTELFGPMWRTGELAVLFGESGAGKSILAVQIAESIARGRNALVESGKLKTESDRSTENGKWKTESSENSSLSTFHYQLSTKAPVQTVLYLDLQHTGAQFDERYSCASPIPGKLPLRYRFSPKLRRASFGDLEIPEAFRGDRRRYLRHSLDLALHETGATVLIIDDLSWFDTGSSRGTSAIRTLRDLKLRCSQSGLSILVLDSINSPRVSGPGVRSPGVRSPHVSKGAYCKPLAIPNSARRFYDIADTVFAIGRSVTFAEDFRYVKPVRTACVSGRPVPHNGDVLTYHLERSAGFAGERSGKKTESSESLALSTIHFPLRRRSSASPTSASPLSPTSSATTPPKPKPATQPKQIASNASVGPATSSTC